MGIYFCHIMLGIVGGLIFSLLFINFDKTWKKGISVFFTVLLEGGSVVALYRGFGITAPDTIFWAIALMLFSFLISFVITMFIVAYLIKDKDDNNVIRIRDILLGQKSYIDRYYEQRHNEITTKIIPDLDKRVRELNNLQEIVDANKAFVESEFARLEESGTKKPKIDLPDHKKIVVTKSYLDSMPSYVSDLSTCINDLNIITNELVENNPDGILTFREFKAYLLDIALHISKDLFKSNDVRIHFRMLDLENQLYKVLVAIRGENAIDRDLTLIPFESNNLIQHSSECRRALIKSLNPDWCFKANNFTTWQDFMTFAFYNVRKDEKVCLSIGISVRNAARYKELLYFLNHINFESFLQENIEKINQIYDIPNTLYSA